MFARGLLLVPLVACASAEDSGVVTADREVASSLVPWKHPEKWPHSVDSARLIVHYQKAGDRDMAETVLADLEEAWRIQVDEQGAAPPLDDGGRAGPDGRFDVYLWRGIDTLYVDAIEENAATPWSDATTFMVLDPWGKYGGAELRPNIFHELRHAEQAVDDWWEHIEFFEAEATMWETAQHGYARLANVWADYQAHPSWTPFRDDDYRTWTMYGGALFLLYLRQHVFHGDLGFSNEVWHLSRNGPGADEDPTLNEPDFADALEQVLAAKGTHLFDELVGFARARWYTGARADGTLQGGADIAEVASTTARRRAGASRVSFTVAPQMLGSVYTVVQKAPGDGAAMKVSLSAVDAPVQPVVQVIGQGAADRVVAGGDLVRFDGGRLVLVVTLLPANGKFDPDTVSSKTYRATVNLDR